MHWNEFAATLTPDEHGRLVNALTAGWGYAHLAVRAAERNAPLALVRFRLGRARELLGVAREILERSAPAASGNGGSLPRTARRPGWREFLQRLPPQAAERLQRAMADAVIDARLAADVVVENGHLRRASQRLDQSLRNLETAWRLSDDPPAQTEADNDD
jgi:hypothetical protein